MAILPVEALVWRSTMVENFLLSASPHVVLSSAAKFQIFVFPSTPACRENGCCWNLRCCSADRRTPQHLAMNPQRRGPGPANLVSAVDCVFTAECWGRINIICYFLFPGRSCRREKNRSKKCAFGWCSVFAERMASSASCYEHPLITSRRHRNRSLGGYLAVGLAPLSTSNALIELVTGSRHCDGIHLSSGFF